MQATETRDEPAVTIDRKGEYRIDCYVRASVPGPTRSRIAAVTDHLQRLDATDVIADYRIRQWPPERHVAETSEAATPPRHELVAAFERWAREHGYSLEPAFRRRELPSWPLGHESDETCERVRVPVVALALRDDDDGSTSTTESESEVNAESVPDLDSLDGVVPYTEPSSIDGRRTYTVDEWLEAVESDWIESGIRTAESGPVSESDPDPEPESGSGSGSGSGFESRSESVSVFDSEYRSILGGRHQR